MSIESLIKNYSPEALLPLPDSTFTTSSFHSSLRSSAMPATLPSQNHKGRRKRSTSLLSPEEISIRRNSPGKHGRIVHFPRTVHRSSLLDNTQHSLGGTLDEGNLISDTKKESDGEISESGWSSESNSHV